MAKKEKLLPPRYECRNIPFYFLNRNEWSRLSETVLRILNQKKGLLATDKIRLVALLALASDGLDNVTFDNLVKAAAFDAPEK